MSDSNGNGKTTSLTVHYVQDDWELLRTMSFEMRLSKSEIIRRAIRFYRGVCMANKQGQRVGIPHPGQTLSTEFVVL